MSKQNHIIPVTCKQINSATVSEGNVKLGYLTANTALVSVVGLVLDVQTDNGRQILSVEDSTGILNGMELYSNDHIEQFCYIELIIQLGTTNDEAVTKYVQKTHPIIDKNQVTTHLLTAYAFHLRHCLSPEPHKTFKAHNKDLEDQKTQQAQGQFGGMGMGMNNNAFGQSATSAFSNTFTGVGSMAGPGYGGASAGPAAGNAAAHANPSEAVLTYMQGQNSDGLTVQEVARAVGLSEHVVDKVIKELVEDGTVFTSTDDFHFSAC